MCRSSMRWNSRRLPRGRAQALERYPGRSQGPGALGDPGTRRGRVARPATGAGRSQHGSKMNAIVAHQPAALVPANEAVRVYALAEKAEATRRAYHADFSLFAAWCQDRGMAA